MEHLLHLVEHFGAAELGDDEVVGKERVAKELSGRRIQIGVWVSEDLESEIRVLLSTEEGAEPEGRYWF